MDKVKALMQTLICTISEKVRGMTEVIKELSEIDLETLAAE